VENTILASENTYDEKKYPTILIMTCIPTVENLYVGTWKTLGEEYNFGFRKHIG
jgi:hypothetical protein